MYFEMDWLQMMADGKKPLPTDILDASNRFYTLIPHDFGMQKPKMLNTIEIIKVCFVRVGCDAPKWSLRSYRFISIFVNGEAQSSNYAVWIKSHDHR